MKTEADDLERASQDVYDRATPIEQERCLELMRHDPMAGMAYFEALSIIQKRPDGT